MAMGKLLLKKTDTRRAIRPPLTAQIHKDEVGITLYCPELNIHTCGKTEQEARRKFIDALVEYWQFLQDHDFKHESPYKEHLKLLTKHAMSARQCIRSTCFLQR